MTPKPDKELAEILGFGYKDPTFINDIHVLIGGKHKIVEAQQRLLAWRDKAVQQAHDAYPDGDYVHKDMVDRAVREARVDELNNFNLPEYDHSKCIDIHSCIGYQNAQSDFDNEKESRIFALHLQDNQGEEEV